MQACVFDSGMLLQVDPANQGGKEPGMLSVVALAIAVHATF